MISTQQQIKGCCFQTSVSNTTLSCMWRCHLCKSEHVRFSPVISQVAANLHQPILHLLHLLLHSLQTLGRKSPPLVPSAPVTHQFFPLKPVLSPTPTSVWTAHPFLHLLHLTTLRVHPFARNATRSRVHPVPRTQICSWRPWANSWDNSYLLMTFSHRRMTTKRFVM